MRRAWANCPIALPTKLSPNQSLVIWSAAAFGGGLTSWLIFYQKIPLPRAPCTIPGIACSCTSAALLPRPASGMYADVCRSSQWLRNGQRVNAWPLSGEVFRQSNSTSIERDTKWLNSCSGMAPSWLEMQNITRFVNDIHTLKYFKAAQQNKVIGYPWKVMSIMP